MDQLIRAKVKNNETMYFQIVEKQNNSGISFNSRLLVLVEDKYFGYVTAFNENSPELSCDPKNIKKRIPIKNIRKISSKNKFLTILINEYNDKNQLSSLKWVFKLPSEQNAKNWIDYIYNSNSPHPSRTNTEHQKNQTDHSPAHSTKKLSNPSLKQLIKAEEQAKNKQKKEQGEEKEENKKQMNEKYRNSQKPFSFQAEDDQRDKNKDLSPDKISQGGQFQENTKVQSLSSKLQRKVDISLVNQQLLQFKNKIEKNKAHKQSKLKQLSTVIGTKKDLYKLNFTNYFREHGKVNDEKLQDFYNLCKQIAEDFSIHREQRDNKQILLQIAQNNGIKVHILYSDLKQIPGGNQICDEGQLKTYLNRFKNMNYLWKVICLTPELSKIFIMPMNCIIEFQGLIYYFVADIHSENFHSSFDTETDYSQYFEKLSSASMIHKLAMEKQRTVKFTPFNHSKFVISEVNQYLPTLIYKSVQLRPQLFTAVTEAKTLSEPYRLKKGRQEEEQQNRLFKQHIQKALNQTCQNLDTIKEYVIHPKQFSNLLHSNGLNMKMLKDVYKKLKNTFVKGIIKTEVAIRAFKMIYRKKIQGTYDQTPEISGESLYKKVTKRMLSVLFAKSKESQTLWKIVNLHSQTYFQISVNKNQINRGYFILGIEEALGIKIKSQCSSCEQLFETADFISDITFFMKVRICDLFWDEQIEASSNTEIATYLVEEFNLKERNFPFYIYQNHQLHERILSTLTQYYGPYSKLAHLNMYNGLQDSSLLTLEYHRRKLTEVNWLIKEGKIKVTEIQKKLDQLYQVLHYYFKFHPFYTEMYELLIKLYAYYGNYEASLQNCKNSLSNTIQLCGGNTMHIKLSSIYYETGECLQEWGKLDQAIVQYKKTKNILENNEYMQKKEYALVLIKLANLYLLKFKDQECYKLLLNSVEILILNKQQQENHQELIKVLSLMNRCDKNIALRTNTILSKTSSLIIQWIKHNVTSDKNIVILLKIILQCYFLENNRLIETDYVQFIQNLSDLLPLSSQNEQALNIIKHLIVNNLFFEIMSQFSTKAKLCKKNLAKVTVRQKNKELQIFQQLHNCLLAVLGEGFLLGITQK